MKKIKAQFLMALFAISIIFSASTFLVRPASAGTTFYVDGTLGDDINACTWPGAGACKTISGPNGALGKASDGETIVVAAGTYGEMVIITKSVTLQGANAGTPWNGVRGPETIWPLGGLAFRPAADHITIDGFKFAGKGGRIIDTYENANFFHLTNCIFDNPVNHGDNGNIQFGGGSHTDMLLDYNFFRDAGDRFLYFGGGPYDRLHIAYNKFNAEGDSIFWATDTPLVDGVVEHNEFDGTIGGVPGVGFNEMNIGKGGNIIIRNNWFHDQQFTAFQIGIIGGSVLNNKFERIYPWPGYFGDVFELWGGEWGTSISNDVQIIGNVINYNDIPDATCPTRGIRLRPSGIDGSTIHVHFNLFLDGGARTDAYAFIHQPGTIVDAVNNWWGGNSGPTSPGSNVNFNPWLVIGLSANPSTIFANGPDSAITADMTKNNQGQDTSGLGHIPDGTEIHFSTNIGSLSMSSVLTTNGKAMTTLTSSTAGTATVKGSMPLYTPDDTASTQVQILTNVFDSKKQVLTDLMNFRDTVTDKDERKKLDDAIDHLKKSLDPSLWIDPAHLNPKHGDKVFNEEKDAVVKLVDLLKDKKSTVDKPTLQDFIGRLVGADKALAQVAIDEAVAAGGDAKKIDKANEELSKGDARAYDGKFVDAIEHYRNAWKHAIEAV